MYICRYARTNKTGLSCKYKDEAIERNRELELIESLRGKKSYIKPTEPACPSDVIRDDRGNPICWQTS